MAAEDDPDNGRSEAGENDDVNAHHLYISLFRFSLRVGSLLAGDKCVNDRSTVSHQQGAEIRERKMERNDKDLEKEEGKEDEFHGEGEREEPSNDAKKPFRFEEEGYWEESMPEQDEDETEQRMTWLRATLSEILELVGIKAHVEGQKREGKIFLEIKGDGGGLIIGKHGQTLDALQYIINKISAHRYKELKEKVILDTENYRGRRVEALKNMTLRMREKVKKLNKAVIIGPLNPQDRRVIHTTLSGDEDVRTESTGEGFYKKLVIAPKSRVGRD